MIDPIYISGPMTGLPDFGYPVFNAAAARLRALGHEVINPAENFGGDSKHPGGRPAYMRLDIEHVLAAKSVAVLPGWQDSRGATIEVTIARELGLPILDADTLEPYCESITDEARRLVYGDRNSAYGAPLDDFTRTAKIWSGILGGDVTAEQVALCMVGVKLSRECNRPKRDNLVDGIGYLLTLHEVYAERDRRAAK